MGGCSPRLFCFVFLLPGYLCSYVLLVSSCFASLSCNFLIYTILTFNQKKKKKKELSEQCKKQERDALLPSRDPFPSSSMAGYWPDCLLPCLSSHPFSLLFPLISFQMAKNKRKLAGTASRTQDLQAPVPSHSNQSGSLVLGLKTASDTPTSTVSHNPSVDLPPLAAITSEAGPSSFSKGDAPPVTNRSPPL